MEYKEDLFIGWIEKRTEAQQLRDQAAARAILTQRDL